MLDWTTEVQAAVRSLAERRPVFHAEADFQQELGFVMRERGYTQVRLERAFPLDGGLAYLDIHAQAPSGPRLAIELKYWTRKSQFKLGDEEFRLGASAANDTRYRLCSDLSRVERLVRAGFAEVGVAVALCGLSAAWGPPGGYRDDQFRIDEGRRLTGRLAWQNSFAPKGKPDLHLHGDYTARWTPYSNNALAGEFRLLVLTYGAA